MRRVIIVIILLFSFSSLLSKNDLYASYGKEKPLHEVIAEAKAKIKKKQTIVEKGMKELEELVAKNAGVIPSKTLGKLPDNFLDNIQSPIAQKITFSDPTCFELELDFHFFDKGTNTKQKANCRQTISLFEFVPLGNSIIEGKQDRSIILLHRKEFQFALSFANRKQYDQAIKAISLLKEYCQDLVHLGALLVDPSGKNKLPDTEEKIQQYRQAAEIELFSKIVVKTPPLTLARKNGYNAIIHATRPENLIKILRRKELMFQANSELIGNESSIPFSVASFDLMHPEMLLPVTENTLPILLFSLDDTIGKAPFYATIGRKADISAYTNKEAVFFKQYFQMIKMHMRYFLHIH